MASRNRPFPSGGKTPRSGALVAFAVLCTLAATWAPTAKGQVLQVPDALRESLDMEFGMVHVYQSYVSESPAISSDGYAARYDLGLSLDLGALSLVRDGSVALHLEGSWRDGIDAIAPAPSSFGANVSAAGDCAIAVGEAFYEQAFISGRVRARLGKLDLTGAGEHQERPAFFDGNAFANDEVSQFLNGALVNNPTIPFPDRTVGIAATGAFGNAGYVAAGLAHAPHADGAVSSGPFAVIEIAATPSFASARGPLPGTWRAGAWHDSRRVPALDNCGAQSGDTGVYLSFDQVARRGSVREDRIGDAGGSEDGAGSTGVFLRVGLARERTQAIAGFWSAGAQWTGLLPSLAGDALGIGVAHGRLSRVAAFETAHETVLEVYYRAPLTSWLSVTPSVQRHHNAGGCARDSAIAGLRVELRRDP